jgi:multisubunit Na+/H+ antiporter MnhG subunit
MPMIEYILAMFTIIAAIHAYTYGRWLKANKNKTGAAGVIILAVSGIALSLYNVFGVK